MYWKFFHVVVGILRRRLRGSEALTGRWFVERAIRSVSRPWLGGTRANMVRIFGPVIPIPVPFAGPGDFYPTAGALSAALGPAPAEAWTYPPSSRLPAPRHTPFFPQ